MQEKGKMLIALAGAAVLLSVTLWRSLAPEKTREENPAPENSASDVCVEPTESVYVLREYDGCVAIFSGAESQAPETVTDIEVRLLPACDRELLSAGIGVEGGAELSMLLEDLGS